jgi:predicted transcriptional regulator
MEDFENILELLRDSRHHSIEEINNILSIPSDRLNKLLSFLQEYGFIEIENGTLMITDLGIKYLELPV